MHSRRCLTAAVLVLTLNVTLAPPVDARPGGLNPASRPCSGGTMVFTDDFNAGHAGSWTTSGPGTWSVDQGQLVVQTDGSSGGMAVAGDNGWTDYVYSVDVRADAGYDKKVAGRIMDSANRYEINFRSTFNDIHLHKLADGVGSTLASTSFPNSNGVWYHVQMAFEGDRIRVCVDGQLIFDYVDAGTTVTHGQVGLVGWGYSTVRYDNIVVSSLRLMQAAFTPSSLQVPPGTPANYTIRLENTSAVDAGTVVVTNTLPAELAYVPGSLAASAGTPLYAGGQILWTGPVSAAGVVTITYAAAILPGTPLGALILNSATVQAATETHILSAAVTVRGGWQLFIPCVSRGCDPLFVDDFSNPGSGWPAGDDGTTRYEYLGGEYRILVRPANWWGAAYPGVAAADFAARVDVRNAAAAEGSLGLVFGISDDWTQLYTFEVWPDGYFGVYRLGGDQWFKLAAGYSGAVSTGAAVNRLRVERNGAQIKAYANGQLLATVNDAAYTGSGHIGVYAGAGQPDLDARFDNFAVYPISCGVGMAALTEPSAPGNYGGEPRNWR